MFIGKSVFESKICLMSTLLILFAIGLGQEAQNTIEEVKELREVESYKVESHKIGHARFRIKLVPYLDIILLDAQTRITVTFCTNLFCIENSEEKIHDFSGKQSYYSIEGLTIADVSVDRGKIERVMLRFESLGGSGVPIQVFELKLPEGLELKENYTSELYLSLDTTFLDTTSAKKPVTEKLIEFLAFGNIHPEADVSFVITPDSPAKIVLEDGFTLDFPAKSIARNTVFSVKVNDISGLSSYLDQVCNC